MRDTGLEQISFPFLNFSENALADEVYGFFDVALPAIAIKITPCVAASATARQHSGHAGATRKPELKGVFVGWVPTHQAQRRVGIHATRGSGMARMLLSFLHTLLWFFCRTYHEQQTQSSGFRGQRAHAIF